MVGPRNFGAIGILYSAKYLQNQLEIDKWAISNVHVGNMLCRGIQCIPRDIGANSCAVSVLKL